MKIILQKLIAQTNDYSRRQAEKLIIDGYVFLNGQKANPGDMADENDKIEVNGRLLKLQQPKKIYIKLNKPEGYTSTTRTFMSEDNVFSLVKLPERLFIAGRLDKDSCGLMILTNDGDFTLLLSHPRFEHKKVYEVQVNPFKTNPNDIIRELRAGIDIGEGDGLVRAQQAKYLQNNLFVITLGEGKKRQIRRMFAALHLHILNLRRISMAGIELGNLKEGQWAYLSEAEINRVKKNK